jgi:oligopeptide transport system permease protein
MAVIGMFVVIIYACLALSAPLLPIHPYDEIILDHQNLPPSWNKTAGDLMMKDKLNNLFFQAWKDGRLVVGDELNAQIKTLIKMNKTNEVWNICYAQGEAQLAAGTFHWSDSDQKAIDRLQKKIDTDLFIDVSKMYVTRNGKKESVTKLNNKTLSQVYADMLGIDVEKVNKQLDQEMHSLIENEVLAQNGTDSKPSDADLELMIKNERKSMGSEYDEKVKLNLIGKIKAQSIRVATKDIKAKNKTGEVQFPFSEDMKVSDNVVASVQASKKDSRHYLLGTDYSGRDMLARIIYGGQISMLIGLVGTLCSVFIGIVLGALAGYRGGRVDSLIMRIVDVLYGLPYMLIVIICMAVFGRNIINLFVALALVSWLTIARMVRGQIMSLKNSEYVEAARSMGAKTWRIIFRHMIPNSLSIIIVYSTLRIPGFIMEESFLSFLGLGVQAPYASWGSLISDGVASMTLYPWRLIFPSIAMTAFLFAMNFLGDGLRDAFDPQSKNQL